MSQQNWMIELSNTGDISCDSTFSSNDQPFQLFTFVIFDHHCNQWITTRNKEINDWMDGCPLDHMTSISKTWIPSSFISYSMIVKLKSIKLGLCISNVHNYVCLRTKCSEKPCLRLIVTSFGKTTSLFFGGMIQPFSYTYVGIDFEMFCLKSILGINITLWMYSSSPNFKEE